MKHITYLHNFNKIKELQDATVNFLQENSPFPDSNRICLTGITDSESWDNNCKREQLKRGRRYINSNYYSVLNKLLVRTIFDEIVQKYSNYARWRLLNIPVGWNYPIHTDGDRNRRIHIPIFTNKNAYLCYYNKPVNDLSENHVTHYHLETGKVYEIDTSFFHTATNWGDGDRWHLIGERFTSA